MALPGREEARALIMAEFEDYIYCCTHLSLTEEDRMTSLEMIKNFAASAKKPFFLAGDMNAEPQSDFIKGLQKDFQILSNPKVPTFPAPKPEETLDYIVTLKNNAKGFAAISSKVQDEPVASDHRPVGGNPPHSRKGRKDIPYKTLFAESGRKRNHRDVGDYRTCLLLGGIRNRLNPTATCAHHYGRTSGV